MPDTLRAEAEKVASKLTYEIGAEGDQHIETRREILANALIAFAEKHAAQVEDDKLRALEADQKATDEYDELRSKGAI